MIMTIIIENKNNKLSKLKLYLLNFNINVGPLKLYLILLENHQYVIIAWHLHKSTLKGYKKAVYYLTRRLLTFHIYFSVLFSTFNKDKGYYQPKIIQNKIHLLFSNSLTRAISCKTSITILVTSYMV